MTRPVGEFRARRTSASLLLAVVVACSACAGNRATPAPPGTHSTASRFMPDPARLADAPPSLRKRLAASPLALFRFVNQAWTREVCRAFAGDLGALPTARLHGDAHVEQYALTAHARGLDDFDDSTRGPAVIDVVRFLGSLELTARGRGWEADLPSIIDDFVRGYRRALEDPAYLPADPAVVRRLRAQGLKSPEAFLSWADSLMQPLTADDVARADAAWARIENYAARFGPEFTPAFLTRKRMGQIHLGIGSALSRKFLIRIEGPSPALADDLVLEAKEVAPLEQQPCLSVPPTADAFRVVEGLRQLGRLDHPLVVALPLLAGARAGVGGWWVKTWERSYRELEVADLASAAELQELAHDVGAQLGATNLKDSAVSLAELKRQAELKGITRLDARIRQVAHELTVAVVEAWERFRRQ
jgi:uncharacterized protein (DUF2252 family)